MAAHRRVPLAAAKQVHPLEPYWGLEGGGKVSSVWVSGARTVGVLAQALLRGRLWRVGGCRKMWTCQRQCRGQSQGGGLGEGVHERVSKRMEGRDAAVPGSGEEGVGEEVEVAAAGVVRGRWQRVVGIRATGEECDEASMLVWYCIAFVLWVFGSFDWYEKDWVCGADEHRSICA